jgi:hypothetical protein
MQNTIEGKLKKISHLAANQTTKIVVFVRLENSSALKEKLKKTLVLIMLR